MIDTWISTHAEQVQMVLFFGLFALFAAIETLAPRRPGPMRRRERWLTNLLLTALNVTVLSLLPITFLSAALWAQEHSWGLFNLLALPLAAAVAGSLLGRGFISFLTHYVMHRVPLFWRMHRVHHLDTELDVSTTVRFHPLEFLLGLGIGLPLVVVLGLSPWVLLLYEILDAGVTVFSHANLRLPRSLDHLLRYLIVTPDLHRVHHSSLQPETNSNFGAVFPIWDLVFGTFRTQTQVAQEAMELGLNEVRDQRVDRLGWLLGSPFISSLEAEGKGTGERSRGQISRKPGATARTKNHLVAAGVLATGLLIVGSLAGCGRSAHHWGYDRGFEGLTGRRLEYALDRIKATEAQRVEIRAILGRLADQTKAFDASADQAAQILRTQWTSESLDVAQLQEVVEAQAAQVRRAGNEGVDEMAALHRVLTPQQRAQVAEWMEDHPRRSGRRVCR